MSHISDARLEQPSNRDRGVTERVTGHKGKSQHSDSYNSTKSSSSSRAAVRARAKVKTARAHALFVQQEAQLKIEEARIRAKLLALEHEKEVAIALAKAEVLGAAAEYESKDGSRSHRGTDHVAMQRTRDYVEQKSEHHLSETGPYTPSLVPLIKPESQTVKGANTFLRGRTA